jgi:hypothetical protein
MEHTPKVFNEQAALDLPAGVDMDDDLMSIAHSIAQAAQEEEVNEQVALDLPAGVDMDDDLMSIAHSIAQAAQEEEDIESEKVSSRLDPIVTDTPVYIDTIEFASPKNTDIEDENTNTVGIPKIGSRAASPKPEATVGSPTKSSKRLPPRPGSRERPPIARASPRNSAHKRSSRRGPPRPEEGTSGGGRRTTRSVPPQDARRQRSANRGDSLSHSLDHVRDDVSLMSDGGISKAETVAAEALDTILTRIQDCKAVLATTPQTEADFAKQLEMAGMIEKLASAAVAMRKLEEMGLQY